MSPKISIVIPVYNAQKTIGSILEKLVAQEYKNIEILTVNDGSGDDSLKILNTFSKKDERVIVVNQRNAGASAARNAGISRSSGEYIMFIDSDDDIDRSLVTKLAMAANRSIDFIFCGMTIGETHIIPADKQVGGEADIKRYVLKSLLTKNLLYGPCCKLFKTDIVKSNSITFPEDIKYGEDTIFVLSYLSYSKSLIAISKSLYIYDTSANGLSANNSAVIKYREARKRALRSFVGKSSSLFVLGLRMLLEVRWSAAYFKSIYKVSK